MSSLFQTFFLVSGTKDHWRLVLLVMTEMKKELSTSPVSAVFPSSLSQLSWAHLSSRVLSQATLPRRFLKRPKSTLLKSKAVGLIFTLIYLFSGSWSRLSHGHFSWGCLWPSHSHWVSMGSYSVSMGSSKALLCVGSSVTWRRNLLLTHTRNLLDCLCPVILALCLAVIKPQFPEKKKPNIRKV